MQPPQQRHLEVEPRLRRAAQLGVGARQHVERPHEVLARESHRERLEAVPLPFPGDLGIGQPGGIDRDDEQIAHDARELAADGAQVVPRLDRLGRQLEDRRRILRGNGVDDGEDELPADEAEDGRDRLRVKCLAGEADDLVEGGEGVAQAAVGRARDEHQRGVVRDDLLGVRDPAELVGDRPEADRLQLEDLRPRLDRRWHLLELGRRHHEEHVRRRLLERLEQGVERRPRQPVDLVDDEDLVAVADRPYPEAGDDDVADLLDLRVRRGVDLEDVDVAPLGDLDARVAGSARVGGRPLHAVQRAREDPRGRRLADAARPGEDVRVRDALAGKRVAERLGDAALADHIVEPRGPPFAGENLVGHRMMIGAPGLSGPGETGASHRGPEDLRHMAGSA